MVLEELVEVFTGKMLAEVSLKVSQALLMEEEVQKSAQTTSPRLEKITFKNMRGGEECFPTFLCNLGVPSSWKQYHRRSGEDARYNLVGLNFIWLTLYQQACEDGDPLLLLFQTGPRNAELKRLIGIG